MYGARIQLFILFSCGWVKKNQVSGVLFPRWNASGCRAVLWWPCWQEWDWPCSPRLEAPCWRAAGCCHGWSGFLLSLLSLLKFGLITGNESPWHVSQCSWGAVVNPPPLLLRGFCPCLTLGKAIFTSHPSLRGHSLQDFLV